MVVGNSRLEAEISEDLTTVRIRLRGQFLEPFELTAPLSVRTDKVVFELTELERMNSVGVRQWDHWMRAISKSAPKAVIELKGMPGFFVDLFNLIHEFVPEPYRVESFYLPCYCEQCEVSSETLVSSADEPLPRRVEQLPALACGTCGQQLDVDIVSDRYFQFMKKSL